MGDNQIYLEDIEVGVQIQPQEYGPWSNAHITRWCAAQEIGRDFIMTINSPPRFSI